MDQEQVDFGVWNSWFSIIALFKTPLNIYQVKRRHLFW